MGEVIKKMPCCLGGLKMGERDTRRGEEVMGREGPMKEV